MIIIVGILIGTLISVSIYKINKTEKERDYWKAEALKHCAKLGEIKILVGRANEWQRLN